MTRLPDLDLVTLWSAGQQVHPAARGAAVLRAVSPDATFDELARLPIGRRDAYLLALREQWFGASLTALADCPACGGRVEVEIPVSLLLDGNDGGDGLENPSHIRPADTHDLMAIASAPDVASARAELLRRCAGDVPAESEDEVIAAIAALDPRADVSIALTCPDCSNGWDSALDIAAFLWSEIDAAARRALRDVHTLAAAYGWTEREILAIPAERRQLYMQMVTG